MPGNPDIEAAETRLATLPAIRFANEQSNISPGRQEELDVPPNGGYGWVCVAAACILNASVWGIASSFGVFLAYYQSHSIFPGTTPFAYAFIGGLSISQCLLVSPLITLCTRTFNVHTTLLLGATLLSTGLLTASYSQRFWHLLLAQGVLFGWGMGFLYVGSLGILPQWFTTRRSLAQGIAASGAGLGGIVYNPLVNVLNQQIGWRSTLRVLAGSAFAVNVLCAAILRDRNSQVKPKLIVFEGRMLKRFEILLLVAWGALSELGYIALFYSLPSYAAAVGLSASQGSVAGTMVSVGLAVGRPVMGYYSDTFGRINMAAFGTGVCGLLCLVLWTFAKSYGVLLVFALLSGTVAGTFWSTIAPVAAEVVGLQDLNSAMSSTFLLLVLPCTFAESIAVVMVGGHGADSWLRPQLFVGFMFVGAALCTMALRAWKLVDIRHQREENAASKEKGPSRLMALHIRAAFQVAKV